MGLFHKKEACPVCGGEVKGLFHKKIGGKKALCKDCSAQVSMAKELLKDATPEFIKEHLEYRRENALKYNALHWEAEYDARGTKMGVDPGVGFLYLIEFRDDENPITDLLDGKLTTHTYLAPYIPAEKIVNIREYDTAALEAALTGGSD